jgi:hypothetical protein
MFSGQKKRRSTAALQDGRRTDHFAAEVVCLQKATPKAFARRGGQAELAKGTRIGICTALNFSVIFVAFCKF